MAAMSNGSELGKAEDRRERRIRDLWISMALLEADRRGLTLDGLPLPRCTAAGLILRLWGKA